MDRLPIISNSIRYNTKKENLLESFDNEWSHIISFYANDVNEVVSLFSDVLYRIFD